MALTVVLSFPADAATKESCHSRACIERVADRQCSQARPAACLRYAALRFRVPYWLLWRIAWCESGLKNRAVSVTGARGIMQFISGTWAITPWASHSPTWARWSALAGAWLLSQKHGRDNWRESRHCWR